MKSMVQLSFDISEDELLILTTTCMQARLSIKDFVHAMILKGLQDFKKEEFKKRLRQSIRQSKEGKGRIISSDELDEMIKDAD